MLIRKAYDYEIKSLFYWSVALTEELSAGYMKRNARMTHEMVTRVLSNGGYYLVASNNLEIMGWILLGIDQNYYKNENVGFIYELYVFPHYRKLGIGRKLMEYGLSQLKKSGMNKVQLNVFNKNSAKKMYEKLGFKDVATLMEKEI
ncbi:GNAT family N-acetyltransferase [Calidifontibacillus erzurumensis]|uniref:GNAT family N-acetyltransferase n=1 Tax=Calidifontibacillus erzurumensis TaxID=2741433 RepID=UPI0035B515C1